jgi:hypothetical protein
MSTVNLHAAVDTATATVALTVAELLDRLATHGVLVLAAAAEVVARLAAPDHHPEDADRARAERALDVGVKAHTLITLVGAVLRAPGRPHRRPGRQAAGRLAAAEPAVTAAVRRSLLDAATTAAREVAAPTAHRLTDAARLGLTDPELRGAALALLTLATDHTPEPLSRDVLRAATERMATGRPPGLETTP